MINSIDYLEEVISRLPEGSFDTETESLVNVHLSQLRTQFDSHGIKSYKIALMRQFFLDTVSKDRGVMPDVSISAMSMIELKAKLFSSDITEEEAEEVFERAGKMMKEFNDFKMEEYER